MATDFITPFVNWTAVDYLHLDWGDKVMRNTDKSIKDPMEKSKNFYIFEFHLIFNHQTLIYRLSRQFYKNLSEFLSICQ